MHRAAAAVAGRGPPPGKQLHDEPELAPALAQGAQLHDVGVAAGAEVHLHLLHRLRRPGELLYRHGLFLAALGDQPRRVYLPLRPRPCAAPPPPA